MWLAEERLAAKRACLLKHMMQAFPSYFQDNIQFRALPTSSLSSWSRLSSLGTVSTMSGTERGASANNALQHQRGMHRTTPSRVAPGQRQHHQFLGAPGGCSALPLGCTEG